MRKFLVGLALMLSAPALAHEDRSELPHWQEASAWPDRIIANVTAEPQTSFAATWRTDHQVGRTIAQIVKASADTRFDVGAITVQAETESLDLERVTTDFGNMNTLENVGLGTVHYHSVVFEDLEPDTLYAWRVQGARGKWSEWFQTRTAAERGPIRFVYFGDAQNGIRSHWSRVIRMAYQTAGDADFMLHAGDLVQKGDSDYNWAEWFDAGSFIHAVIPAIPVPGNHENITVYNEAGERERVRTPVWRAQFTLPEEKGLAETYWESAYKIAYSDDLDIFVVDSARDDFDEMAVWLDAALSESTAKWTVVTMHHPFFVPETMHGRGRDMVRQKAFMPLMKKHDVDLVLTGHIHTYGRMSASETAFDRTSRQASGTPTDIETLYVISAAGAKNYPVWSEVPDTSIYGDGQTDFSGLSVDRVAENTPMFQVIDIDGGELRYTAYTATGIAYDAFRVHQDETGHKTLVEGEQAFGDTRYFSNTSEHLDWIDLR
ncbi:MAG: metallophosphatase [Ponticaulis sp.]|nr:metallophosphatase [Ponticaulis sp.]|tara:strand:+ start:6212 stop:7681 length:1470 start_codon:yes stop_codon:yes gene_type:complete